jgi:thiol-disulfide isomerase/thioredoxin
MNRRLSNKPFLALAALALGAVVLTATRPALAETKIGDTAPKLSIDAFVKGKEVKEFEKGKTYVVEFWATWCGPCRTSIPHLTELQKKFKDKVVLIGVSDEDAATVKPFVEKMGDKMDYVVAIDKNEGTSAAYMKAFGVGGIPHAFVVNPEGKLVWHGHPMDGLDKVLDKVVAGKFDIAEAKKQAEKEAAEAAAMEKVGQAANDYLSLAASSDKPDTKKLKDLGGKLADAAKDSPKVANRIAWLILTHPQIKYRDNEFALKLAKGAVDGTEGKDAAILDTYARALHDGGKLAEAVEQQKKAVEQAPEGMREELRKTLEKYEAEANRKGRK